MAGPRAPAGWYPDPDDPGVIRYWDGTAWTDRAAASELAALERRARSAGSGTPEPASVVQAPRPMLPWALGVAGVVAVLLLVAVVAGRDEPDPFGDQPSDQRAVVELIQGARDQYADATNDLQRNAALEERDEDICAVLGDGRVENWTGQVYEIEDDSDGRGVLGINIEPDTQVLNRAGGLSGEGTLIEPGPLLDRVTQLEEGQVVTFGGRFVADEDDASCFTNPRLTQSNEIGKPLMVIRYTDVRRSG